MRISEAESVDHGSPVALVSRAQSAEDIVADDRAGAGLAGGDREDAAESPAQEKRDRRRT